MSKKITPRSKNYSQWYIDIVREAKLADYSDVKGCMIIRPNGYAIWEKMQAVLDKEIKDTGHVNAYFPIFIPQSYMEKEKEHVKGFEEECAMVTHGRGEPLAEKLYVRPTSETIIWNAFKKWIQSYRDLPILINQWANVVRWELRTRFFLRTSEFLWQEGHTAHATEKEANEEVLRMIRIYKSFVEDYMAIPTILGIKTESEKFSGAVETYCIEAMMQDGKALQIGTSHHLGQNFSKAFDCKFQNQRKVLEYVWATSWGISTRLIGALIMTHSDDKGLILPPNLASREIVMVPIYGEKDTGVLEKCEEVRKLLINHGLQVHFDSSDQNSPGWKFAEYELQGIPIRLEIGPRDIKSNTCMVVRRDTGKKESMSLDDSLGSNLQLLLSNIQQTLYDRAVLMRNKKTVAVNTYDELKSQVEKGFALAYWDGSSETEQKIKEETKATIRCMPEDNDFMIQALIGQLRDKKCVVTGNPSETLCVFARAY